ncbi:MAG: ATP-binding cassette domain-containing protein [Clostridiales bacterium]|jgi:energy-coupling factor transport system ATP-binding protein|nr:ATP-binding cassette domain-containing protein [Eubacteriales bacterium]MDH7566217.1 ATP-binding cassette domain-containing protein [Clostridiales bacterium]
MALIEIKDLNFTYPEEKTKALSHVNLTVEEGEFVVLCGPSGSGKTTLLRNLKREVTPAGTRTGSIFYGGRPLYELPDEAAAKEIGMVFQDPENQIVMDTVIHELAFSLENFGLQPVDIKKRIGEMATFFGLEDCLHKPVAELSGGQKQVVNLCSVMLLKPRVLLLDEPTSQLDPVAAHELIKMVYQINQELSVTVILSEHRLEQLFPIADRITFMEEGTVKYDCTPRDMSRGVMEKRDLKTEPFLPSVTRMFFYMQQGKGGGGTGDIPLSVREGKRFMEKIKGRIQSFIEKNGKMERRTPGEEGIDRDPLLVCKEISFRYDREKPLILQKLSLSVMKGEFLVILGGNGAGKSTLLQVMAGLIRPQQGSVYFKKKKLELIHPKERHEIIGYVAQNPLLHFTFDTVEGELQYMVRKSGKTSSGEKTEEIIELFGLKGLLSRHPYDLSGGQQQKLAIACALIPQPELLLIDEPTKGLDAISKENFALLLKELGKKGTTIVMVTHDTEFAARHAQKCAMLFDGSVTGCSEPAVFFSGNYFYTTAVNRVVRDYLPYAVTDEDVMKACNI